MKKIIVLTLILILFPMILVSFPRVIWIVKGQEIITINPDGTISPSNAPIVVNEPIWGKDFYTITSDISDKKIVVLKDSISIDGEGRSLLGNSGIDTGIELQNVNGVRILNLNIMGFENGVKIIDGGANQIFGNIISNNVNSGIKLLGASRWHNIQSNTIKENGGAGISLTGDSSWTTIVSNRIESNQIGIEIMDMSEKNTIANNAFVDNISQFGEYNHKENYWNGDYGDANGNYWSDYTSIYVGILDEKSGPDQNEPGADGIWDHPYYIYSSGDVKDNYPLVEEPIKFETTISIRLDPPSARINAYFKDDVEIVGEIEPIVSGATVTLRIRSNATNSQEMSVPLTTNQAGQYRYTLMNIGSPLEYQLQASWEGSSSYYGATSRLFSFSTYWSDVPESAPAKNWWEEIPGFPPESILIGVILATGILYIHKRKRT